VGEALKVKIKLYGASAGGLEKNELELELPENAMTEDVVNQLPVRDRVYLYVVRDGMRLSQDARLRDGDTLLVFPPVTGGDH
jgi:molybdopterin converting factor small subunit